MAESDHEQLAERLEQESDELEHRARELDGKIEHAKTDWAGKRADPSVPGAPPPEAHGDEEHSE